MQFAECSAVDLIKFSVYYRLAVTEVLTELSGDLKVKKKAPLIYQLSISISDSMSSLNVHVYSS